MNTNTGYLLDKILIVEDEPILRSNISAFLELEGFQVYTAADGLEAKQILKTKRISLIFSDWMIPFVDGIELLKYVKTNPEFNHIPFILLTAKTTIEDKLNALDCMADDFISKPFLSKELVYKCRNHIESRKNLISSKLHPTEEINYNSRDAKFLNQVKSYIETNLSNEKLCLSNFTSQFPLSQSAFQKNIKRITGKSIFQLVLEARLIKAKELIMNDVGPISEIIESCGFSHHNYFAKKFKEKFGAAPNQFRRIN